MKRSLRYSLLLFFSLGFFNTFAQTWQEVGNGTNDGIKAILVDPSDNSLVVGGNFTMASSVSAARIARFDAGTWSPLGGGLNAQVNALIIFSGRLFAGGKFTISGGVPNNGVARWDGTKWLVTSSGLTAGTEVTSFCVYNAELYAGTNDGVYKYSGGTWTNVSAGQVTGRVEKLQVFNAELYAGGAFNMATGSGFDHIAKYNGTVWSAVGAGTDGPVRDLYVFSSALYAGGEFMNAGGMPAAGIASWNGTAWSASGAEPLPAKVRFVEYHNELYAYGKFTTSATEDFAKWNGTNWTTLTFGLDSLINALTVYNDEIYSGGDYSYFNSIVPVRHLSRFTSVTLSAYTKSTTITCNGTSDGLIRSVGYGGARPYTYLWSSAETTSDISGLAPGTYDVTVTDAVSQTASASVTITEPAVLTAPVTTIANACDGSACVSAAGGNGGYSYIWAPAPMAGQLTSCITGSVGSYDVTVTDVKGCSASTPATLTATSSFPSNVVTASGPTSICQGDSVTLTASPADSYAWSDGSATPSITVKNTGVYTVTMTNTGGCSTVSDPVTVNVADLPLTSIVAGGPTTFCEFDSVTLSTPSNAAFSYEWLRDGLTIPAATDTSYKAGQSGNYRVRAYNACGSDTSATIPVTVNITPPPSVSGPVTYCQDSAATCLTATGASLLWYTSSSGGVGSATCPVPGTSAADTVSYFVSQTMGGCESARSQIDVIVYYTAAPVPLTPVDYCKDAVPSPLSAAGTALKWYDSAAGGTATTTPFTPSTVLGGATYYWVSQTENGCESPRSQITVNVYDTPAPVAVDTIGYCNGAAALPLSAAGADLLWYTSSTGGTGSSAAPTPATAADGITKYFVSQTLNGCEGPRDSVTVIVSTIAAPVTTPTYFCQGGSSSCLTATGTSLKWYVSPTGGTGVNCIAPSTVATGTTTFYVSQKINSCESPRASLVVTIRATPAAPNVIAPTVNYCKGAPSSALNAIGNNLRWYTAQTGGIGSVTAPVPSTSTVGQFRHYVSQTVNGCESTRALITVNVRNLPNATIASDGPATICAGSTLRLNSFGGDATHNYKWSTGSTQPNITVSSGGAYYLVLTNSFGCKDTSNILTVTVRPLPVPVLTINGPTTFCNGKYVILGTTQSYAGYSWSDGKTFSKDTVYSGGYHKVVVNDDIGCRGTSDSVLVTVTPVAEVPIKVDGSLDFCFGDSVSLAVTGSYSNPRWSNGMTTSPVYIKTDTSIYVEAQDQNGCIGRSATKSITIYPLPEAKITRAGSILASSSASSYQWFKDDVSIPGETSQNLILFSNGIYKVKLTSIHGCTSVSDTVKIEFVGIEETSLFTGFSVYPNPFTGEGQIEYELSKPSEVTLEVYNALGSKVRTLVDGERQYGRHTYKLSASDVEDKAGIYFIKLTIDNQSFMRKISKL